MSPRQYASPVSPSLLAAVLVAALLLPNVAAASKCTAAKYKAIGNAAAKKAKCKAKAVRKGEAVDAECLAKVEAKLISKLSKAEQKGDCLTTGDENELLTIVDTFITQSMSALEPLPPAAVGCCALSGGTCVSSPTYEPQLCVDIGGTPGTLGEVCDAGTGTCQTPPSSLGPCCESGACFSGPGVDSAGCAELLGSFFPSAACLANQTCGIP